MLKRVLIGLILLAISVIHSGSAEASPGPSVATIPRSASDGRFLSTLNFSGTNWLLFSPGGQGHYLYVVTVDQVANGGLALTKNHDTQLLVFDVADPKHPSQVSDTSLGAFNATQLLVHDDVAFVLQGEFSESKNPSQIMAISIRDPHHPKIGGKLDAEFNWAQISPNGKLVALRSLKIFQYSPVFIDVSNYQHLHAADALSDTDKSFVIPFDKFNPRDQTPQRFNGSDLYVARSWSSNSAFVIFRTSPGQFSANKLLQVYKSISGDYKSCAETRKIYCETDIANLEFAGVRNLLRERPEGISGGQRIVILNDYGFWLAKAQDYPKAVAALDVVVGLAPKRAVAWLNLADAAQQAMIRADEDEEKVAYWKKADEAYGRYTELTGMVPPGGKHMSVFNLPSAMTSSKDVCEYIAGAYNAGGQDSISAQSGTAYQAGKRVSFSIGWEGGSCSSQVVKLAGQDEAADKLQPDAPGQPAIRIIPFRGKSYILAEVDNGPYSVRAPYGQNICSFKRGYNARLTINSDLKLCRAVLNDEGSTIDWLNRAGFAGGSNS